MAMTHDKEPAVVTQTLYYPAGDDDGALKRLCRCIGMAGLGLIAQVVSAQGRWRERALLAEVDGTVLRDVGLSPADIAGELRKPSWRRREDQAGGSGRA